ncbi:unnamed protein product [Rhodiola kirilowii]
MASPSSLPPSMTHPPALEDFEPVKKPKRNKFAFACAILASMTSILLGYDIGVMSGAIIYIQKDLDLSDVQIEILAGILSVYSLIGSFAAGRTSDRIGRRYTIVLAGAIFFAGALLMGFATNYTFLMFWSLRGWDRRRLRPHDRPGIHRRSLPGLDERLLNLVSRSVHQYRDFTRLCLQLRLLQASFILRMAHDARYWRHSIGLSRPRRSCDARITAMARDARTLRRREKGPRQDFRLEGRGEFKTVRDQTGCRHTRTRNKQRSFSLRQPQPRRRRVARTHHQPNFDHPPHRHRRSRHPLLPTNLRHRRRRPLLPTHLPLCRNHQPRPTTPRHRRRRLRQNNFHPHCHFQPRPLRPPSSPPHLRRRIDPLSPHTRHQPHHHLILLSQNPLRHRHLHPRSPRFRRHFLNRHGTDYVGVQLGNLSAPAPSSGNQHRRRRQQTHQRRHLHDIISLSKAITIGGAFYLFAGIAIVAWCFFFTLLPETRGKTLEEMQVLFGNLNWKREQRKMEKMKTRGDAADVAQEVQLAGRDNNNNNM